MKDFEDFYGPGTGGYDPELYNWIPSAFKDWDV